MSEKAARRGKVRLPETPRSLPPNLAAWLSETTPYIGFLDPQEPPAMVFRRPTHLDHPAEIQTSVASH